MALTRTPWGESSVERVRTTPMSAVVGCEPEELGADLRLKVEFHPAGDDITLPYFRPVS